MTIAAATTGDHANAIAKREENPMRKLLLAVAGIAGLAMSGTAFAADYKIMAPAAPGGGWDQTARAMQDRAAGRGHLGQRAGDQRSRRRRHDRPCPVRQPGQWRSLAADRRRLRHGRRDPDQRLAGHARPGHADRPPDRRIRGASSFRRHPTSRHGRAGRQAEGRSRARYPGPAARPAAPTTSPPG